MGPPPTSKDSNKEPSATEQLAAQVSQQAWRAHDKAGAVLEKQAEEGRQKGLEKGLGSKHSSLELLHEEAAVAKREKRERQAREPPQEEAGPSLPASYGALSELFRRVQMAMHLQRNRWPLCRSHAHLAPNTLTPVRVSAGPR